MSNRVDRGFLDRSKKIRFTFDNKPYEGLEGDTLASALLANGVHLVGRSFKYHRPRGILSCGSEEPNALVGVSRSGQSHTPNVRATVQEIFDGLTATSQNRYPSLVFDVGSVNNMLGRFFPAGFYYKTFMWPRGAWERVYEPLIRRMAGLGESPSHPDSDRYANRYVHCDYLIVGGGAAGLAAARSASEHGSVILCDENDMLGGWTLIDSRLRIDGDTGVDWTRHITNELSEHPNVRLLTRSTAFGYFQQNMVSIVERVTDHLASPSPDLPRERLWQVRAKRVILAQGSIERPMIFPGNDRPGIMLSGAAHKFLNKYGVRVGSCIGVYTACDTAYLSAFDLQDSGCEIAVIVDRREDVPSSLLDEASSRDIIVSSNSSVTGTRGAYRVRSMSVTDNDTGTSDDYRIDCLLMSSGWTPSLHLYSQSRGRPEWDGETQRFLPTGDSPQACVSVGSCAGTETLLGCLSESSEAGGAKMKYKVKDAVSLGSGINGPSPGMNPDHARRAFVDYQNDVTTKDIRLAVDEGMHSIEHIKRYTTTGMATDQGKLSNIHGLSIASQRLNRSVSDVGLTTFRPPYTPVTFGTFANYSSDRLFDPRRLTPLHDWSKDYAVFEPVGNWDRARYFPTAGEDMRAAVSRECRTVRTTAGLFDASTLGKIEVTGSDAAEFLDIIYTNRISRLQPGRCGYGIMLREDGYIYDDGVIARLSDDRFHVTTTTGGAASVLNHMEDYAQTEFPDMNVWLTSVSEQWCVIAVQGPKSREILSSFIDIDITAKKFLHMSYSDCLFDSSQKIPCRLFRISFTGELGYELNVPSDYGLYVWRKLLECGESLGACVYGTEAMHVLRAEKGYIIVGQDTDGTVTPHDVGYSWAVSTKKLDFVGKRGLQRPDLIASGRRQLVGLRTTDPSIVLEEGAQIVFDSTERIPAKMVGFVTSSYWSESLGHSIALALIEGGFGRIGEKVFVPMSDDIIEATITGTQFYDESGERLHG